MNVKNPLLTLLHVCRYIYSYKQKLLEKLKTEKHVNHPLFTSDGLR